LGEGFRSELDPESTTGEATDQFNWRRKLEVIGDAELNVSGREL